MFVNYKFRLKSKNEIIIANKTFEINFLHFVDKLYFIDYN